MSSSHAHNLTTCSAPEFCDVHKDEICSFLISQHRILNEENVRDCTLSCSPKPIPRVPTTELQSCETCFDRMINGQKRIKTDCVQQKCYPGFTRCKKISYTVESKMHNYREQMSMKSCASETECTVREGEWKRFFKGIRAIWMPDVVVSDFVMQC